MSNISDTPPPPPPPPSEPEDTPIAENEKDSPNGLSGREIVAFKAQAISDRLDAEFTFIGQQVESLKEISDSPTYREMRSIQQQLSDVKARLEKEDPTDSTTELKLLGEQIEDYQKASKGSK